MRETDLRLKKENPEFYKRLQIRAVFKQIQAKFPPPTIREGILIEGNTENWKGLFALATTRLQIQGKMYSTGRILTWLYRDGNNMHPVLRMQRDSSCMVIHQDKYLINESIKEVYQRFAKAMCAPNIEEMQKQINLGRFVGAVSMPWKRGSAAII